MLLPDHRNSPRLARDALVLGPSAALNRDPTTTPSVNDPTQTVPQVCVPQQPPAPEPPALTTIVDRQSKEDRTLCPARALRFYLDRTKDLRGSRSLLFISFKKGHTSDIRPATLSSWLKQTILLCYKQADQQPLDLVQVKAHDIRAFAASKAFYGGVSVDQIMQACHWKAHNTFTNFYLKDLTWSDTDNDMYLGPVVAAQQVLDPSPQTSCPRKEKRGGGGGGAHPLQPSLQESLPGSRYSFTFKM